MTMPCLRCGAARDCQHRTVEKPRMLGKPEFEQPNLRVRDQRQKPANPFGQKGAPVRRDLEKLVEGLFGKPTN